MKNIIKSLVLTAAMGLVSAAMADGSSYLYWMLEDTQDSTLMESWSYARVKVVDADADESADGVAYLVSASNGDVTKFGKEGEDGIGYIDKTLTTIGSTYLSDSYKFIAELYNSGDKVVGLSNAILGGSINAGTSALGLSSNEFTGVHVPEPTSGMLALIGFGLLALRRKQEIA